MKLHYSQTEQFIRIIENPVSVPYEITLLSNSIITSASEKSVSVPYEITLLSNVVLNKKQTVLVSVPYEITLLSNFNSR